MPTSNVILTFQETGAPAYYPPEVAGKINELADEA